MDHLREIVFVAILIISALSSFLKKQSKPDGEADLNRRLEEALRESLRRKAGGASPTPGAPPPGPQPILIGTETGAKRVPPPTPPPMPVGMDSKFPALPPAPVAVPAPKPPPVRVSVSVKTAPAPEAAARGAADAQRLPSPDRGFGERAAAPASTAVPVAASSSPLISTAAARTVAPAADAVSHATWTAGGGHDIGLRRAWAPAEIVPVGSVPTTARPRRAAGILGDPKQMVIASVIMGPPKALRRRYSGLLDQPIA